MTTKKDSIEILEVNTDEFGKLRVKARFNYADGTYRELVYKTTSQRTDDEIESILVRKFEKSKPFKIKAIKVATKKREKILKEKFKQKYKTEK